jgi:hypothetical protein
MIKGWSFAKIITLPIPDAALTDFPVEVPIVADADIGGECLASGFDLRFTAADGVTELPYERESFAVTTGEATGIFWVKTSVVTAGTHIWCYYGNAAAADGATPSAVWDTNFKAVYHMNDATTSTILDSTANDNDGAKEAANEPIESAGKIGKGQTCDGGNDCIFTGVDPSTELGQEVTVDAWVYPHGQGNYDGVWGAHDLTGVKGLKLEYNVGAGGWQFGFADGSIMNNLLIGDLTLNDWTHVVAVFKGSSYIKAYVNSAETSTVVASNISHEAAFTIGRAYPDPSCYFDGIIDELRISSIARSAEWIAYEYANMNPADGGLTWGAEKNVKSAVHSFFES